MRLELLREVEVVEVVRFVVQVSCFQPASTSQFGPADIHIDLEVIPPPRFRVVTWNLGMNKNKMVKSQIIE